MKSWIQELKENLSKPGIIELEGIKRLMLDLIEEIESLENKQPGYFGRQEEDIS